MAEPAALNNILIKPEYLGKEVAITRMNEYGRMGTAFLFLISYDMSRTVLIREPLSAGRTDIKFTFPKYSNHTSIDICTSVPTLEFTSPSRELYASQYERVQREFQKGNIYLLNLTRATIVDSEATLQDIYYQGQAKYKVWYPGHFVVFSPETFIRIENGRIHTHPMKGTIRADIPGAKEALRNDSKEQAEHASVVDLLRNDIGRIAKSVEVVRYRYFEKVKAGDHDLWQASSEIEGVLTDDFASSLGNILFALLPAGSITGVPKKNAISIIQQVEDYDRGFYTGICGYFDGKDLDSGVMIRFIEHAPEGLVYKSGGGIHQMSEMEKEYQELIQKIYVPVH